MNALSILVLTTLAGQGGPPTIRGEIQAARPDMVLKWNDIALQAIRDDRTSPPVAARNLAIIHLAIYDAVMAIERTHQPYLVEAPAGAGPGASAEVAAATAAHRTLVELYPKQRATLDILYARCLADLPRGQACDAGVHLGRFVAEKMLAARCNDGSTEAGKYALKSFPGAWRATAPHFKDALLPEWGHVKPFAIKRGTQYPPPGPPALTSLQYAAAFNEVKRLGERHSPERTEDQTQIAHFWADDVGTCTPPGHWNMIAQAVAKERGSTLAENARTFAHLNMSLADAGILCWVIKFTFDYWRPITAIREIPGEETWRSLLDTPPFPAYISGHSTFSSAGAASLAQSFGTDAVRFTTTSDGVPGMKRCFTSLWAAAEEAGVSRIYGGIHWKFDNVDGLAVGKTLGEYVSRNTLLPRPSVSGRRALYPEPPVIITDR